MNFKGVIFDFDGTLMDSMQTWETMGSDYLRKRGIEPEEGLDYKFRTMSIEDAAIYYQQNYDISDSKEDIIKGINSMVETLYFKEALPKKGVIEMLEDFYKKGIKMCIATATDKYLVDAAVKRCNLEKYFEGVLTCTIVGAGKDQPVIYEKGLELIGTKKEETIVMEDILHAIETSKNAGFTVAAIYDSSSKEYSNEIKKLADYYITDFYDINTILSK